MHFYMHSYLHKFFILVKSGCYTKLPGLTICSGVSDGVTNFTRAGGPAVVTTHWVGATLDIVPFGYTFVEIVTEWEPCHIYKAILQTI
jgi:hypothetical protein